MNLKRSLNQLFGQFGIKVGFADPALAVAWNHDQSIQLDFDFILRDFMMSPDTPDSVTFMQVGAFDGISGDPLHDYIRRYDWEGLLLEPQSRFFQQLQQTYADEDGLRLVRGAIDHENGCRTLYTVSDPEAEDVPGFAGTLASFDRSTLLSHSDRIPDLQERIHGEKVPTYNPMTLLENEGLLDLDLIQIDVEGFDNEVLHMLDLNELTPYIIQFEDKHLSTNKHLEAVEYLISNGYQVAKSGADTVGYRRP